MKTIGIVAFLALVGNIAAGVVPSTLERDGGEDYAPSPDWKRDGGEDYAPSPDWKRDGGEDYAPSPDW